MEELEVSIAGYEEQLHQVQAAHDASPDESGRQELSTLITDLQELIQLSKQSLLEMKRKELLSQLSEFGDDEAEDDGRVEAAQPQPTGVNTDEVVSVEQNDEEKIDLASLEGMKCRAPHAHASGSSSYHDAIIFGCVEETATAHALSGDVHVRVVFSHPTQISMRPCPFFLESRCRFTDESCKFSHGEVVPLASLKEYEEPDFGNLEEGSSVLAKSDDDGLWHHAKVEGVETGSGNEHIVHVRFSHNNSTIKSLPVEAVLPLSRGDDDDDEDDSGRTTTTTLAFDEEDDFIPDELSARLAGVSSGSLGDWEKYTRGMGSKLMASMGYIMGEGLGRRQEGRVLPVPAMLYPAGRSLDWCMRLRERAGGSSDALTVEKTLKRQQEREERRSAKRAERESAAGTLAVFDFINKTLGDGRKRSSGLTDTSSGVNLRKDTKSEGASSSIQPNSSSSKSNSNLNVARFQVSEEIRRHERDVVKLRQSYARLRDRDPAAAKSVANRLEEKQKTIKSLHERETSIQAKQSTLSEKRKLTIF